MSLLSDVKCCSGSNFKFPNSVLRQIFGGMIAYGTVYLKVVKSVCI